MEQPENNDEVIKGDINLKNLHLGRTVTRRHAELVKSTEGKNDSNTTTKKGGAKNKKASMVEQPSMVRLICRKQCQRNCVIDVWPYLDITKENGHQSKSTV